MRSEPRAPGWLDFWSRPHRIYVNDRHRRVHYARIADEILALLPRPGARVLDFGCGEALEAHRVAERCGRLFLCEAAESVRAELERRYADHPRITVIADVADPRVAEESLDLLVVVSVLQYLARAEFEDLLPLFRRKLAPGGVLVLADVLPPTTSVVADTANLLRTAARHGFLLAALGGLASLAVGEYARLRRRLGLTRWAPEELLALLRRHGFAAERNPRNLGFDPNRMTFLARRADQPRGVAGAKVQCR
ncbi:MAG: methyltransferase domain-containing protein [Geminicoccaceae bacterium]|nr:methyltransferase domain-containing protein [Geminicoccaceae bacterium]